MNLPAYQSLTLAAHDLSADLSEFSEWALAIAAWNRDARTFGMRGFSDRHPDHKRVYTEIIGLVRRKFLEKTRPNFYRLTPLGCSEAARLNGSHSPASLPVMDHYEAVARFVLHPALVAWRDDPDYPREWGVIPDFLGTTQIPRADPSHAAAVRAIRDACRAAMAWMSRLNLVYLTGPSRKAAPLHYRDVAAVVNFLTALEYRFPCLKG